MDVKKQIEALINDNKPIYSISRLDTITRCLQEAYFTYVLDDRGKDNVYGVMGGRIHQVLEDLINGKVTKEHLVSSLESDIKAIEMFDLKFPSDTVRTNWILDMRHFCQNYEKPEGSFETEEQVLYKSPDGNYVQGFIDLIKHNDDGSIDIIDYKTSTMYKKSERIEHGRQLIVYAMAKEQQGYKVNKICWNFLKYALIEYYGYKTNLSRRKTLISRKIERRNIAMTISDAVATEMKELGYDDILIDGYLTKLKQTNNIDVLPEEIAKLFTIKQCYVECELNDETRKECQEYIDNTIYKWENVTEYTHMSFTKPAKKTGGEREDIFYCTKLCAHRDKCKHIQEYLHQKELKEQSEDDELKKLFS